MELCPGSRVVPEMPVSPPGIPVPGVSTGPTWSQNEQVKSSPQ